MREAFDTSRAVAEELLNVSVSDVAPDTILCMAVGEIDFLTGPTLREKLTEAINVVPSHLVIDLSAVQFLASSGLNILLEVLAAQEASGHHLALVVNNNHAVTRTLRVTELDQVFNLHTELATAVTACRTSTGVPQQQAQQPEPLHQAPLGVTEMSILRQPSG
jgi:anti-sigma B factor antagonist